MPFVTVFLLAATASAQGAPPAPPSTTPTPVGEYPPAPAPAPVSSAPEAPQPAPVAPPTPQGYPPPGSGYPPPGYGYPPPGYSPPPGYGYPPPGYAYPPGYAAPGYAPRGEPPEGADAIEPGAPAWRPSNPGFVIAVERVGGVYYTSSERGPSSVSAAGTSVDFSSVDISGTSVNFLGSGYGGSIDPYSTPMLSLHGVLGPGLTLGGGIGFQSDSATLNDDTGSENTTISNYVVAPRFGYIANVGKIVSLWIRGGITYSSMTIERDPSCPPGSICLSVTNQTISVLALSVDPMLVVAPIPHVAFLFGPALDIGLSGSQKASIGGTFSSDIEQHWKASSFGVAAGVAVFL